MSEHCISNNTACTSLSACIDQGLRRVQCCRARCQRHHILPSNALDDSAHYTQFNGQPNAKPGFVATEAEQTQMKLQDTLEGNASPTEPVAPNLDHRHCDPHHYRCTIECTLAVNAAANNLHNVCCFVKPPSSQLLL